MKIRLSLFQRLLLQILGIFVGIFVLMSLLIFYEQDSKQSSIVDYSNAIWYTIVTLTGVGYGDLYPSTIYGRLIGYIFLLLNLVASLIFIGRIATFFTTVKQNRRLGYNGTTFENHAIIIGWNEMTRRVTDQLLHVKKQISIVTDSKESVDHIHEKYSQKKRQVYVLYADHTNYEFLGKANIKKAQIIFVNLGTDTEKLVYVLDLKKYYPNKEYVVILENAQLKEAFLHGGVKYALAKDEIVSTMLASYIFEPYVAKYSEELLSCAKDHDTDYDIKQYRVSPQNPYRNQEYGLAFVDLKKRYNIILLGLNRKNEKEEHILIKNPKGKLLIQESDYLIVMTDGTSSRRLEEELKTNEGV